MEAEESIREIGREVSDAVDLIRAKHAGGNSDEAVGLLLDAAKALKTDRFDEALSFVKKAQSKAKPNTEYLLSNAKGFASQAEKNFGAEKYEDSISLWKKAADEYSIALKVGEERGESDIVTSIGLVKKKINENVEKAEIAIDNREMLRFVADGKSSVENAKNFFENEEFEEAKRAYEDAKIAFAAAQKLAEKRDFEEERKKLAEALKSIDPSIEVTLLRRCHLELNEAEMAFKTKKFAETEELLEKALIFMEGLKIHNEKLEIMKRHGREMLLMVKLEQGKEQMGSADLFIETNRYYDAMEAYKGAKNCFDNLHSEASNFGLSKIVQKSKKLCEACDMNISRAKKALLDVTDVTPKFIRADDIPVDDILVKDLLVDDIFVKEFLSDNLDKPQDDIRPPSKPDIPQSISRYFPGELVARYRSVEYIGRGGFARVFKVKGQDEKFVAIKLPSSSDAVTGKSFISELMNWTGLKHENIVRVYDFNILPIPYFEMELCDCALSEKEFPLDTNSSAWIIFNLCEGLKYAHSKSIIHQDLKPHNILLKEGIPKISDWGLSKVSTTSGTSSLGGYTPLYAAPEQISKKFGKRDVRTDIWQLGAIFYEIVTGKTPFEGDDPLAIMSSIMMEEPELPSSINPEADKLDPIIMKCLEKKQDKRYQSVSEFQNDIAEFLRIDYTESLRVSISQNDLRRSAFYCGDLLVIHLKLGDLETAHKYACDLLHYAQGDIGDITNELCNQLELRIDNEMDTVPEELMRKAEIIAHNVRLGFSRINSLETAKNDIMARKLHESTEDEKKDEKRRNSSEKMLE